VLVQFALMVFVLCGLLSLVVDVGFARLTQGQMQVAADAAALEGLQKRNVGVRNPVTGAVINDAFASDCLRRAGAHRLVDWTFDGDFDTSDGDPAQPFGAGPILTATDGVSNLHALQTVSVPDPHVYDPDMQLNQQNQVYGDMVSGRFCYTTDPRPSESGEYELQELVCTEPQRASGAYARNDFNPSVTPPGPPPGLDACPAADEAPPTPFPLPGTGTLNTVNDSAFLVRLRRSNEFQGLDAQTEPGVGSSGPSLPLTFGKATTLYGDDPYGGYSMRRDGVTVRATAIASIRPALHVGLPQTNPVQPGVTPFALLDTYVAALPANGAQVTIEPATGLLCAGVACTPAAPRIGRFIDQLTDATRRRWTLISTVGRALPAPTPLNCALTGSRAGFGPVYSMLAQGAGLRVIGFSRITLNQDPARPANPCAKLLVRQPQLVAAANASAAVTAGLPLPIGVSPAVVRELLDKNLVRPGRANYVPVLVATLAR
jgi:hypothetical protein